MLIKTLFKIGKFIFFVVIRLIMFSPRAKFSLVHENFITITNKNKKYFLMVVVLGLGKKGLLC